MEWIAYSLYWIVTLLGIGFIFLPLASRLLPAQRDRGFAASIPLGIIAISYIQYVLGTLHILPFTRPSLFLLLILAAIGNILIFKRYYLKAKGESLAQGLIAWYTGIFRRRLIIFECALFALSFLFLAYIRGQEPSAHGLEKFMDFGFINAILRSEFFPARDMWYGPDSTNPAGYPINYYYFGHLTSAIIIRLTDVISSIGYNLTLAAILAQSMILCFSFGYQFVTPIPKARSRALLLHAIIVGILAALLVNMAGNFHTIYLFTKGYPAESPVPFWQILSSYNPTSYWYPNATRFIPFTIHEFPSYSYVVADLHGHVFDIPFVLLTLTLLYSFFTNVRIFGHTFAFSKSFSGSKSDTALYTFSNAQTLLLGMLLAIHYMTNAFDGPIYLLLIAILLFLTHRSIWGFFTKLALLVGSFLAFSLPFSAFFKPFPSSIGVNCPSQLLSLFGQKNVYQIGPFLLDPAKCQVSQWWMWLTLWGFFVASAALFGWVMWRKYQKSQITTHDIFIAVLYVFGLFLVTIPEYFYAKDIYPDHFRANTMFKLGYQAFIMLSLASAYTYWQLRHALRARMLVVIYALLVVLPLLYPFYSFKSYYGPLTNNPQLDGAQWMKNSMQADYELIQYISSSVGEYKVVLEAQGDSYTDHNRISAYTGLPTAAGWWVHEWLWRGSADVVGMRSPDIALIYETQDTDIARRLLQKYRVSYVVVSRLEREKYPQLQEGKFEQVGRKIFTSSDGFGALYRVD
jgi:YYY domain-containing protein